MRRDPPCATCRVEPEWENRQVVRIYGYLEDQWRQDGGGLPVLENSEIESAMRMLGVAAEQQAEVLADIKILAAAIRKAVKQSLEREKAKAGRYGTTQH